MHFTEKYEISFSGTNPQTYQLLKTKTAIENNFKTLQKLVSTTGFGHIEMLKNRTRYLLVKNVDIQPLCDFIDSYQIDQPSIKNGTIYGTISSYIKEQKKSNKISEWSICIISNTDDRVFIDYAGKTPRGERQPNENVATYELSYNRETVTMGCSIRNQQIGRGSEYYLIAKNQIDQTGDRQVDLSEKKATYAEIKEQRAKENKGLLLIYALDERGTQNVKNNIPIVGFSLHFPKLDDEIKVSYTTAINPNLEQELMFDDDTENQ